MTELHVRTIHEGAMARFEIVNAEGREYVETLDDPQTNSLVGELRDNDGFLIEGRGVLRPGDVAYPGNVVLVRGVE